MKTKFAETIFKNQIDIPRYSRVGADASGFLFICNALTDRCIGVTTKFFSSTQSQATAIVPERGDIVRMTAAGIIAANSIVGPAANGRVAQGAAPRVGIAQTAATAAGDVVDVLWDPDPALPQIVTLTDAATVAIDAGGGVEWKLTFTAAIGNARAIANPTNLVDGRVYILELLQDSVGSRTVGSWGSKFNFPAATPPTLSTAANARDILTFRYDLGKDKLDYLGGQFAL